MKNYKQFTFIKAKAKRQSKERTARRVKEVRENWEGFRNSWAWREMLTEKQKKKPDN